MLRIAAVCTLCLTTLGCLNREPLEKSPERHSHQKTIGHLPQPHFHPKASDPEWFGPVVQLHGHLGPWVVAGARLGMAGCHALDANAHFDVEVICEGPFAKTPQSCFIDGIQLATGATLGKRTIHDVEAEKIVVRLRNTHSGDTVEVRPSDKLMNLLTAPGPETADKKDEKTTDKDHAPDWVEQRARDIAAMPDEQLLIISGP